MTVDPSTVLRLDGKTALITGGTKGIGFGIAEAFVAAGASVCINSRKADGLEAAAASLRSAGGSVTTFMGSAGDIEIAEGAVKHCIDTFGSCDIVVNNAATNPQFGPLVEAEMSKVKKVFDVNLLGALNFCQAAWRLWQKDNGGVVLNIVSIGGMRVGAMIGAYNVSKAALIHMTKQLALEMAPSVRVNAIAPALVKTDMARALWEADEVGAAKGHPLKRLGTPDDIAAAALFLCSDASSWMTGEIMVVDGGRTLN